MTTTIRYATEADAPAIAELNIICFQDGPMYRNMLPNIDPLSATPMKLSRTYDKLANPRMHVLVATDPTSNQILGCARWLMPDASAHWRDESEMAILSDDARAKAAQMTQLRPAGMNVAVYEGLFKALEEMRGKYVREGDIGECTFPPFFFFFFISVSGRRRVADGRGPGTSSGTSGDASAASRERGGKGLAGLGSADGRPETGAHLSGGHAGGVSAVSQVRMAGCGGYCDGLLGVRGGGRGHICSDDSGAGPPPSSQLRTEDLAFCTRHSTERICWTVHITPYHRDCHQ